MKRIGIILALVMAPAPLLAQKFDKLSFMAGCWSAVTGKDQTAEEVWSTPVERMMVGYTRYYEKEKPTHWDFNYVERTDSTIILVTTPHGQAPDTFRLKTLADEVASWTRSGSEFPGLVMYRLASDGALIARLEAPPGVDQTSVEVRFVRARCPGEKK